MIVILDREHPRVSILDRLGRDGYVTIVKTCIMIVIPTCDSVSISLNFHSMRLKLILINLS